MSAIPVSVEELRQVLAYNPDTGVFKWKVSRPGPNARAGWLAGSKTNMGYWEICYKRTKYYGHRLAWAYVNGEFPTKDIDHINGIKDDNRIDNLRESEVHQNMANQKLRVDNTSGHKGVCYHKATGKWRARVTHKGKEIYLGLFKDMEAACEAVSEARLKYHGEYANDGKEN